jgi:hypothetical protein
LAPRSLALAISYFLLSPSSFFTPNSFVSHLQLVLRQAVVVAHPEHHGFFRGRRQLRRERDFKVRAVPPRLRRHVPARNAAKGVPGERQGGGGGGAKALGLRGLDLACLFESYEKKNEEEKKDKRSTKV